MADRRAVLVEHCGTLLTGHLLWSYDDVGRQAASHGRTPAHQSPAPSHQGAGTVWPAAPVESLRMTRKSSSATQSIAPPLSLVLALCAVVVLMGMIWGVVTVAVSRGGSSCPSTGKVATESRCR